MDESELLAERRRKLERLREAGVEPFPENFHGRTPAAEVLERHAGLEEEEEAAETYRLAGRLAARRGHGKAAFLDIEDRSGRIQLHARQDVLGEENFDRLVTSISAT
jgi:lysyl-tRNA synthetase class 2